MFGKTTRVLIVDDMKTMRMVLARALKGLGIEHIEEADDGDTALAKIEQAVAGGQAFDLVFSDWTMPRMKGIDLLRSVRKHPKLRETPFIMVTAEAEKEHVVEALKAGASHYVTKPFVLADLVEKMTAVHAKLKKVA